MLLKHALTFFILLFILQVFHSRFIVTVHGIYDPLSVPNNKYGIHIIDENDLQNAAALVNSSNGSFGYVTIVIAERERNVEKWKQIFQRMRELELIPILRLATRLEGIVWAAPKERDATEWVSFLSALPWYTKNRYIVLFNEPNHAKEWGGELAPENYAQILKTFSSFLKSSSDDFFILPAGLDASAPNGPDTLDEATYLLRMKNEVPDVFEYIDGWTSHSYPNPGFVGTLTQTGKGSMRTFEWELAFLKSLGVNRALPIFITETGWPHNEGTSRVSNYYSVDTINDLIVEAAQTIWSDERIVAVTPFVLNYQSQPFSHFSWQVLGSHSFYPHFDSYRSLAKIQGVPVLVDKYFITPTPILIAQEKTISSDENKSVKTILYRLLALLSQALGT